MTTAIPQHRTDRPLVSGLIVAAVCVASFWVWLGHAGFGSTEGHRVIPAWEMLDSGDWWLPHLFERVYLRKPPGMAWAIASLSSVLGRTEFAARAVSAAAATLSALLALAFARRWFGPRAGLAAGLAQACMPVWLTFARSAEIEALHTLACQAAVLMTLDLILVPRAAQVRRGAALALAVTAAGLIKGPAGAPVLLGALAAGALAARSWRALARWPLVTGLAIAGVALAGLYMAMKARLDALGAVPVLQDPSEFVPSLKRAPQILRLFPAALLEGLPMTGTVFLAFWPGAHAAGAAPGLQVPERADVRARARALALTFLFGVVFLMISGVSNPRYALPALTPLAPLAGWAWVGRLGLFHGWPRRLATWTALGRLWAWPTVAMLFVGVYVFGFMEPRRAEISGIAPGTALADALPGDCTVYADWLVEARPDVLLYARRHAADTGKKIRVRWVDLDTFVPEPGQPAAVVARTDAQGDEFKRPEFVSKVAGWRQIHSGTVYKYTFVVLERTERSHTMSASHGHLSPDNLKIRN